MTSKETADVLVGMYDKLTDDERAVIARLIRDAKQLMQLKECMDGTMQSLKAMLKHNGPVSVPYATFASINPDDEVLCSMNTVTNCIDMQYVSYEIEQNAPEVVLN